MNLEMVAKRLEALGNPTRLSIYRLLVKGGMGGCRVGDLQQRLDIPASTLSHHISKLVWVGLVDQERRGRTLICRPLWQAMDETMQFLNEECCTPQGSAGASQ